MKPTKQRIAAQLRDLRKLIDNSKDPCETRIAYGMEMAIRWVTEDTEGWPGMAVEARNLARLPRSEML